MFKTCIFKRNLNFSREPIVKLVFQFSFADFPFVKPMLIKPVLLVPKGYNPKALPIQKCFIPLWSMSSISWCPMLMTVVHSYSRVSSFLHRQIKRSYYPREKRFFERLELRRKTKCVFRWSMSVKQARIHTGFHRFTEIGHIFHNKYIFNNEKLSKLKSCSISNKQHGN